MEKAKLLLNASANCGNCQLNIINLYNKGTSFGNHGNTHAYQHMCRDLP